jgi:alpha-1,2-mannosyltransferase
MARLMTPAVTQGSAREGRALRVAPYIALAVLAFLARLLPVLRGGGLWGLGVYDDGVYYTGAAALVAGRTPYADFVLLHPPGVVLALSPFALLGRLISDPTGYAVARVAFMALGAANTVLVALLARRFGWVAAVVSGLFYAIWFPATYWEARTTIEPLATALMLGALLLLLPRTGRPSGSATARPNGRATPWATALAGALLGLTLGIKIWSVAPVAVLVLWHLVTVGRAATVRLVAGVAAGAAVIWLPFLAAAPGPMLRMVVLAQLGRPRMPITNGGRLGSILNLTPHFSHVPSRLKLVILGVALLVVLGAAVAAWTRKEARVVVLLLVTSTVVVLAGPSYYRHYSSFPAPFLAVVVGVAVTVVLARATRRVAAAATAAVLVVVTGAAVTPMARRLNDPFPGAQLGRLAVGKGCVMADDPSALILMGVLSRDLTRGCPQPVDFSGATYDVASERGPDGQPVSRRRNGRWQRYAVRELTSGSMTVLARLDEDGFDRATVRRLQALPDVATIDGYPLRGR